MSNRDGPASERLRKSERLVALDARTGDELWSAEVGRGTASPITFALDGRQYVTILAGQAVSGERPGADAPSVWTFALDGGR